MRKSWLAGGSFGYSYTSGNDNSSTKDIRSKSWFVQFSPYAGYFIIDRLCLGLRLNYTTNDLKAWLTENSITTLSCTKYYTLMPGLFLRYYTTKGIFFEAEGAWGFTRDYSVTPAVNSNDRSFSIGAGYSLFLSKSVAIEPMVSYELSKTTRESSGENNSSKKIFLKIGLQYYFGHKSAKE